CGPLTELPAQPEAFLDRRQYRGRVILRVVYGCASRKKRRHDHRRYPGARTPFIRPACSPGRWNVVPRTAVLVIRDDDGRGGPVGRIGLDRLEQTDQMTVAAVQIRIPGVFGFGAERFDERDGREM